MRPLPLIIHYSTVHTKLERHHFSRMTGSNVAKSQCKKLMKMGLSVFGGRGFNSAKCKTVVKMAVARIKLLRNKREVVVRQMRKDIALLLQSGQDATARIRVEHVIREQNVMAANELLELFCELIVSRLTIIAKQRECPADLKEGISSLIFAAPRCSDIPELLDIRDVFAKKYGKDFVSAAIDMRPNAGVNRMLIEKLSVRTPFGEVKLKFLKEIAKEYKVDWDTTESETELLKPPEELIDGPSTFTSASTFPVKPNQTQQFKQPEKLPNRCVDDGNSGSDMMHFKDSASAAEAAAEAAKKAIAAAEVAAYLSRKETGTSGLNNTMHNGAMNGNHISNGKISGKYAPKDLTRSSDNLHDKLQMEERMKRSNTVANIPPSGVDPQNMYRRHGYNVPPACSDIEFDESECDEEIEAEQPASSNGLPPNWSPDIEATSFHRQHSHNVSSTNLKVKYDESDYEDDGDMEEYTGVKQPPNRPAPLAPHPTYLKQNSVPGVHPKLPDCDALAARIESLKYQKFQP